MKITCTVSKPILDQVLSAQSRIADIERSISTTQAAMQQQQELLSTQTEDKSQAANQLQDLRAERQILVAGLAMGEGNEAELEAIEQRLSEALSNAKSQGQASIIAKDTMTGLQRRMDKLKQDQEAAQQRHQEALAALVEEIAQEAVAEYLPKVVTLAESLAKLKGLKSLFSRHKGAVANAADRIGFGHLDIPSPAKLSKHKDASGLLDMENSYRSLVPDYRVDALATQTREAIKAQLEALGIQLA